MNSDTASLNSMALKIHTLFKMTMLQLDQGEPARFWGCENELTREAQSFGTSKSS